MPERMQAVVQQAFGGPEVLKMAEVEIEWADQQPR